MKTIVLFGSNIDVRGGADENWGNWGNNQLFMTRPEVRALCREANMKVMRGPHTVPLTVSDLSQICDAVIEIGAECLITLPTMAPVAECVAVVEGLGDLATIFEMGNEPIIENAATGHPTPEEYAAWFREAVTACRAVNPNAKFGGPTCEVPWGTWGHGDEFYTVLLDACGDILDFLSFHHYTTNNWEMVNAPQPQEVLLSRASANYERAVLYLKDLSRAKIGHEIPVACTEFNWTGAFQQGTTIPRWDLDEVFITEWTQRTMRGLIRGGAWLGIQWKVTGYRDHMAMIVEEPVNGGVIIPKYMYYAFKEVSTPISPLEMLIRAALSAATGVGLILLSL